MSQTGWIILAVANAPLYWLLGRFFFPAWDEFGEALRFWFRPDVVSWRRGEYRADWRAEMKLSVWLLACGGCVLGEGRLIETATAWA